MAAGSIGCVVGGDAVVGDVLTAIVVDAGATGPAVTVVAVDSTTTTVVALVLGGALEPLAQPAAMAATPITAAARPRSGRGHEPGR